MTPERAPHVGQAEEPPAQQPAKPVVVEPDRRAKDRTDHTVDTCHVLAHTPAHAGRLTRDSELHESGGRPREADPGTRTPADRRRTIGRAGNHSLSPAAGRVGSPAATAGLLRPADATAGGAPVLLVGYARRLDSAGAVGPWTRRSAGGAIVAGNLISSTTRSALNTPTTPGISGGGGPFTPSSRPSAPTLTAAPAEPLDLGGDRRAARAR